MLMGTAKVVPFLFVYSVFIVDIISRKVHNTIQCDKALKY